MDQVLLYGVQWFLLFNKYRASGGDFDLVKAEFEALKAQLTAALPAPPNGVEWTDDDLLALVAEHAALTGAIRDRHGDDAA